MQFHFGLRLAKTCGYKIRGQSNNMKGDTGT